MCKRKRDRDVRVWYKNSTVWGILRRVRGNKAIVDLPWFGLTEYEVPRSDVWEFDRTIWDWRPV